ncbi:EamA family transporter RarD [Mycolicibacterium sp.]|uniref:EamA family transporter RarD n=1 Tax=Mycolicibacterium sp. TaxID=2320850 RepID=UPI0028ADF2E0|nr:EamA family transporter RarD [Mycolicibacterium sp.]
MSREPATREAGLLYGVAAYGLWGVFPAFFSLLAPAGAPEILAHRIVWTVVLMAVVLVAVGRLGDLRNITGRTRFLLAGASVLISTNWLIYIFAVNEGHVVDAALGYFITPLFSVMLGVVLFGERLNRVQIVAVLLAAAAVILLSFGAVGLPWIGVGLALSFGFYSAVKKMVPTDPRVSVAVETAVAAPFALVYLVVLAFNGDSDFTNHGPVHVALMLLCGPVTALPLLCFAAAAQRLPLVTLGLLQYLTPSMQMIWGVLVDHEPMPPARWLGFALIWVALAIFSTDAISRAHRNRPGTLHAS